MMTLRNRSVCSVRMEDITIYSWFLWRTLSWEGRLFGILSDHSRLSHKHRRLVTSELTYCELRTKIVSHPNLVIAFEMHFKFPYRSYVKWLFNLTSPILIIKHERTINQVAIKSTINIALVIINYCPSSSTLRMRILYP